MPTNLPCRRYLGDGVYAGYDGYHIWLITSDGIKRTNQIALDSHVYSALLKYVQDLHGGDLENEDDKEGGGS